MKNKEQLKAEIESTIKAIDLYSGEAAVWYSSITLTL